MDKNVRLARPIRALAWLVLTALVASPLLVALVAHAATGDVDMFSTSFTPKTIYIHSGDRVKWTNSDVVMHNVTMSSGGMNINQDVLPADQGTNTYTSSPFPSGTFNYYCRIHKDQGMTGTVTTNAPPPQPSPTVTATTTRPGGGGSPKPTKKPKSPTPTPTTSRSATPNPTGIASATATPTPTETLPSSSPLPTFAGGDTGSGDNNNLGAVAAIVVVIVLGGAGYLVYRRFIASP
jgi:plastocyanin